jgi:hypothetical protein
MVNGECEKCFRQQRSPHHLWQQIQKGVMRISTDARYRENRSGD